MGHSGHKRQFPRGDAPALVAAFAAAYSCPDCTADTELRRQETGVYVLRVAHDDSCPTWRRIQRAGDEKVS